MAALAIKICNQFLDIVLASSGYTLMTKFRLDWGILARLIMLQEQETIKTSYLYQELDLLLFPIIIALFSRK